MIACSYKSPSGLLERSALIESGEGTASAAATHARGPSRLQADVTGRDFQSHRRLGSTNHVSDKTLFEVLELPKPGRALDHSRQNSVPDIVDCPQAAWRDTSPLD